MTIKKYPVRCYKCGEVTDTPVSRAVLFYNKNNYSFEDRVYPFCSDECCEEFKLKIRKKNLKAVIQRNIKILKKTLYEELS